jgi:hypothetical protein
MLKRKIISGSKKRVATSKEQKSLAPEKNNQIIPILPIMPTPDQNQYLDNLLIINEMCSILFFKSNLNNDSDKTMTIQADHFCNFA